MHGAIWSEQWRAPENWLGDLEQTLASHHAITRRGDDYSAWDLEARGGIFANARFLMALEDHAGGRQYAKYRAWMAPTRKTMGAMLVGTLALVSGLFAQSSFTLLAAAIFLLLWVWQLLRDWSQASGQLRAALADLGASRQTLSSIEAVPLSFEAEQQVEAPLVAQNR
jgi:hypothetical protein